jgi:aminoglycoside phosphotransferase (APT) family kinase protein
MVDRFTCARGDFHPVNILVNDGKIKAVIDWSNSMIVDAEYDIAATKTILLRVGHAFREERLNTELVHDYLNIYRSISSFDESKIEFFEGLHCARRCSF